MIEIDEEWFCSEIAYMYEFMEISGEDNENLEPISQAIYARMLGWD